MIKLFFSYSHTDEPMRDELEKHLAVLKRQGVIESWHDRRIVAGSNLDTSISANLETSDVILLLVSPDFLASEYAYEVEATRALERHRAGEAVVIPVILEPCDWLNSPLGKLRATPKDGKPVAKYPNRNDAYLEIINDIRGAAQNLGKEQASPPRSTAGQPGPIRPDQRSSNLRIKKAFSDQERDRFVDEAFLYIRNFIAASLEELKARNPGVEFRFRNEGEVAFSVAIYIGGEKRSSCRIWLSRGDAFGDISYAASDSGPGNSVNESMHVQDDGYQLGFKSMGFSMRSRGEELLSPHGAAEAFWSMLIDRLQ